MRLVYGANSQGQGHLSKAAVLVPLLEAAGNDVLVVTSGPPVPSFYSFRRHLHLAGLPYAVTSGQTDFKRTAWNWARSLGPISHSLRTLKRTIIDFAPDLIISDFEPLTASPLLVPDCEVVAVCRQLALSEKSIAAADSHGFESRLTRTVIRLFTAGADRLHCYHYEPATFRCLPPILRDEVRKAVPVMGDHLLVYLHYGDADSLIKWANSRQVNVKVYGMQHVPRGQHGLVTFCPPGRATMLEDLSTSRAVLTNAGLTTPLEAFVLGKPVAVTPIDGQWEQVVNAHQLDQTGIARRVCQGDWDACLEVAPPAINHPSRAWLSTPTEQVLEVICGQPLKRKPTTTKDASPARVLRAA